MQITLSLDTSSKNLRHDLEEAKALLDAINMAARDTSTRKWIEVEDAKKDDQIEMDRKSREMDLTNLNRR